MSVTESLTPEEQLRHERESQGLPPGGPDGRSVAERAAEEPEASPEEQEEMFPLGTIEGDPNVTARNMIRAGQAVEVTASLRSAEVPVTNGTLFGPDHRGQLLVTFRPEKTHLVPQRDSDTDKTTGWKCRQVLRPSYVQDAGKTLNRIDLEDLLTSAAIDEESIGRVLALFDGE